MDDFSKKLKSFSNPFKTKFKGQGQKLGGADEGGDASKSNPPGVPRTGPAAAKTLLNQRLQQEELLKRQEQERREAQRQRWAQDKMGQSSNGAPSQSNPAPASPSARPLPNQVQPSKTPNINPKPLTHKALSPASSPSVKPPSFAPEPPPTEFDPFRPFMGSGRALEARGGAQEESSTSGSQMDVDPGRNEDEVQTAIALLLSDASFRPAIEVLLKLLGNIVAHPGNEKFRRVRLGNPKIADTVGKASGGVQLLRAVGFEMREEKDAEGKEEEWAVLADASPEVLKALEASAQLLERGLASQPIHIPPGSLVKKPEVLEQERLRAQREKAQQPKEEEPVTPSDRQLKVFLPASENAASRIEVPDSFYKLSPSEVRAEAAARKKALENSQLLVPKSFKEKQAQQARENFKAAMIRVQFPDGMILQGVFSPLERTAAIYEFVGSALKNPAQTFHLVYSYPTKNPIIPAFSAVRGGKVPTLLEAELVPSALLKYRGHDNDTTPFSGLQNELVLEARSL